MMISLREAKINEYDTFFTLIDFYSDEELLLKIESSDGLIFSFSLIDYGKNKFKKQKFIFNFVKNFNFVKKLDFFYPNRLHLMYMVYELCSFIETYYQLNQYIKFGL